VISLDPIHHKIVVDSDVVELQPLTFSLFAKLLEHENQVVSISSLTDEVWGNVTVSPETLKQRIFLLRKALDEARVDACFIQSVRGQGYRLVVRNERRASGAALARRRLLATLGLIATLVIAAVFSWQVWQPYDPPPNSRIVFWRASQADFTHDAADQWEQAWMTQLSSSDEIIFVAAERDPAQSITVQARHAKAALISVWTHFESDGQRLVRMQILEPKTASTLRSDLAAMDDTEEMTRLLTAQMEAIERVLESGTLPLLTEALNNTDHPAWARLRNLASDQG
jgi:DNA-binding winged helix-turn-helix (wHTH) protein